MTKEKKLLINIKKHISRTGPAILLITLILMSGCKNSYTQLDLSMYQYRDTKNLVKFVHDASLIIKKDGINSLSYFRDNRNLFNTKDYYLYIYDMNGSNIYNAGIEQLEGEDLRNITDINGKKITELALNALADTNNPHSWVHYSWWKPEKLYPTTKSSCHFKVITPDNHTLFVGGGMNYPHEEKEFIRIIVDDAVQLLKEKGKEAIPEISSPASQYNYREVHTFAFYPDGKIIISPVTGNKQIPVSPLNCIDEVGAKPFVKAISILKSKDHAWVIFMARNRYHRKLIKKCLYLRKSTLNKKTIYIGAITDLPQPPY